MNFMRGVLNGLLLAAVMWAGIFGLLWLALHGDDIQQGRVEQSSHGDAR